jgi:hypothetical protein
LELGQNIYSTVYGSLEIIRKTLKWWSKIVTLWIFYWFKKTKIFCVSACAKQIPTLAVHALKTFYLMISMKRKMFSYRTLILRTLSALKIKRLLSMRKKHVTLAECLTMICIRYISRHFQEHHKSSLRLTRARASYALIDKNVREQHRHSCRQTIPGAQRAQHSLLYNRHVCGARTGSRWTDTSWVCTGCYSTDRSRSSTGCYRTARSGPAGCCGKDMSGCIDSKPVSKDALLLKGVWHEICDFSFFHESVFPGPLSIPLGPFQLFSKIRGENREWMFISGVNMTVCISCSISSDKHLPIFLDDDILLWCLYSKLAHGWSIESVYR